MLAQLKKCPMDLLIEIVTELLFEGILAGAASKKLPIILRVLLAMIPIALLLGITVLLFSGAIHAHSFLLFAAACGMLIFCLYCAVRIVKQVLRDK